MSLILDALRKSEAERRRGDLPALALELPPPAPSATRTRAWWLVFPVAVAGGALVFWLTRPGEVPVPAAQPVVATQAGPVQREQRERQPFQARSAPADHGPVAAVAEAPAVPAPVAPIPPPPVEAAAEPAPVDHAASAAPSAPILALADLTADERRALPPLKLSMHMWSAAPASRFVIVDGRRLGEGDRTGNAVVERIDPDGVILAADGRRIRLPLP